MKLRLGKTLVAELDENFVWQCQSPEAAAMLNAVTDAALAAHSPADGEPSAAVAARVAEFGEVEYDSPSEKTPAGVVF